MFNRTIRVWDIWLLPSRVTYKDTYWIGYDIDPTKGVVTFKKLL